MQKRQGAALFSPDGLDARFDAARCHLATCAVRVQRQHFNINFFADLAVMLAHCNVIEGETS